MKKLFSVSFQFSQSPSKYLNMPSALGITLCHIQVGVPLRRLRLFGAQNPQDPLQLNQFIIVPTCGLSPLLLKVGKDVKAAGPSILQCQSCQGCLGPPASAIVCCYKWLCRCKSSYPKSQLLGLYINSLIHSQNMQNLQIFRFLFQVSLKSNSMNLWI